ncbi:MAG: hypothetical protein JW864_02610 [Spirochaetes bacterium]|nr:hypothetical protein [Spirochaetota bacterium]
MNYDSVLLIVFQFMAYTFLGWIIEVIHRSLSQRRYVNAGFLFGPFLPVYGTGAMIAVMLGSIFKGLHPVFVFFLLGIILSVFEYFTGFFMEKLFNIKLWDYNNNRFNIHGRVSLLYSTIWAFLAAVFLYLIHPTANRYLKFISSDIIKISSFLFIIYFFVDLFFSIASIKALRKKVAYLYENYISLNNSEVYPIVKSFNRLVRAFPEINKYINKNIGIRIKEKMNSLKLNLAQVFPEITADNPKIDGEYLNCVSDILGNKEFQKLKEFPHHNSTIYEHSLSVSYIVYYLSKSFKLDYKSATRGALLHDFFLYNWRESDPSRKNLHGLRHPRIALKNAEKEFTLNDIERDIIIKHMWPLTPVPPRYKESFIVTFADKYVASKEFIFEIRKRIREK